MVGQYEYDAWGKILSVKNGSGATITNNTDPAMVNPFRYRGDSYDSETGLYYQNSRYYDPEIKRFINADDPAYIGVGRSFVGFSLFAYCGNNPVTGYDPTGHWDWGGILVGLSIIASVAITVATCGIASPLAAVFAGAAVTTGVVTTYAAATDSTMVIDVSYSYQITPNTYGKGGASLVIDFEEDEMNVYAHGGGGRGISSGMSYAVGLVGNYEEAKDYSEYFVDIGVGMNIGIDHGWDPRVPYDVATNSISVTFSSGFSFNAGIDYYYKPKRVYAW